MPIDESEPIYLLAVDKFRELVLGNLRFEVILTDTDLSLKNALTTLYPEVPQLLRIWHVHVNKNVEKAVADYWKTNTSNENNEENKEKRKGFLDKWNSFTTAFPSKYRHLGHSATSRGENWHRAFKRYLLSSRHDLLDLKDEWTNIIRVFLNGYIAELSHGRIRIYHDLNSKGWDDLLDLDLNKHVVPRGMKLLVDRLIYSKDELVYNKSCGGAFTQIYGIPSYHEIQNRKPLSVKIPRTTFIHIGFLNARSMAKNAASRNHLSHHQVQSSLSHKSITRGRRQKDKSTRRDPSSWELATSVSRTSPRYNDLAELVVRLLHQSTTLRSPSVQPQGTSRLPT
ncbi:hypothetical protein PsorP6_015199 [Peronosclerospora sorghi]|uniref:Uncharacterized protein n=1 Tax=Peronosclerospora sorghi TaxID=230839 RepID=A0ACC0VRI4_9STRA|nr:hypothetical protein PsorP6_015199 [Peronosclerospora sorghi]